MIAIYIAGIILIIIGFVIAMKGAGDLGDYLGNKLDAYLVRKKEGKR